MITGRISHRLDTLLLIAVAACGSAIVHAEEGSTKIPERVRCSSEFRMEKGTNRARITITAEIAPDWYIPSVTTPFGTKMRLKVSPELLADPKSSITFQADKAPKQEQVPTGDSKELVFESHEGKVTWTGVTKLAADFDPERTPLKIAVRGSASNNTFASSVMVHLEVVSKFVGTIESVDTKTK